MHQIVHECVSSWLNYGSAIKPCHISVFFFVGAEINLLCLLNKPVSPPLYGALLNNGCHRLRAAIKLVSINSRSLFVFFTSFLVYFSFVCVITILEVTLTFHYFFIIAKINQIFSYANDQQLLFNV